MVMARYLRDPNGHPPPSGVEERRLKIYRDLIYNNIEGFISGGFPVLRSLYAEDDWHGLVRLFIDRHRCHTPYFLEISQEFLRFLMEDFQPRPCDPPFILELAHYEWVELALDVSEEELPEPQPVVDLLAGVPRLSPLAWVLAYQYPVHRIGPSFRPAEPGEGVYLAVYRDREDKVQFMELNAATARLLELIRDNEQATVVAVLQALAGELGMEPTALQEFGAGQLAQFVEKSVVLVTETADEAVASGDCGG
ncbi:MAG: DUF2063 domain-containing protein [Haliea sp.]|nr:DUF2063 domain-containing protein [Haliea sp.]